MGDFKLITDKEQFSYEAERTWNAVVPNNVGRGKIATHMDSPRLISFYIPYIRGAPHISIVVCDKSDAKRIVYYKTNKNRIGPNMLSLMGANLEEEISKYAFSVMKANNINPAGRIQKAYTDNIIYKSRKVNGPGLLAYRRYSTYPDNLNIIDFFLITTKEARELVYYDNNIKKKGLPNIYSNIYCTVVVLSNGIVQLGTPRRFNDQSDIPRFTEGVENDLLQWEANTIVDMNGRIASMPLDMPVSDRVTIARGEFDKFFDLRSRRRADYAVLYPEAWVNSGNLLDNLGTATLISNARKRAKCLRGIRSSSVLEA